VEYFYDLAPLNPASCTKNITLVSGEKIAGPVKKELDGTVFSKFTQLTEALYVSPSEKITDELNKSFE